MKLIKRFIYLKKMLFLYWIEFNSLQFAENEAYKKSLELDLQRAHKTTAFSVFKQRLYALIESFLNWRFICDFAELSSDFPQDQQNEVVDRIYILGITF